MCWMKERWPRHQQTWNISFTGLTKYGQTTVIPLLRPRRKPTTYGPGLQSEIYQS